MHLVSQYDKGTYFKQHPNPIITDTLRGMFSIRPTDDKYFKAISRSN